VAIDERHDFIVGRDNGPLQIVQVAQYIRAPRHASQRDLTDDEGMGDDLVAREQRDQLSIRGTEVVNPD